MGRAALLTLVGRYAHASRIEELAVTEAVSLLEIQKLMYFLQEAGQPLQLAYDKGRYGPYAENLNHVVQTLEGHYLRGYGDRTQRIVALAPVALQPGAEDEAQQWLAEHGDDATIARVRSVLRLFRGFASAYGAELLATVHWTATREAPGQDSDPAALTRLISAWNERKGRVFTQDHIASAFSHLEGLGWIG